MVSTQLSRFTVLWLLNTGFDLLLLLSVSSPLLFSLSLSTYWRTQGPSFHSLQLILILFVRDLWFKLTEQFKQQQEEAKRIAEREEWYKQREIEKQLRAPKHKHRPAQIFMSDEARALVESVITELRKLRYLLFSSFPLHFFPSLLPCTSSLPSSLLLF